MDTKDISEKILKEVKEIVQRKGTTAEQDTEDIKKVFDKYIKRTAS